jgi:hypothetical protein
MCGIVGLVSPSFSQKEEKIFKNMLVADTLRGAHSTGVVAVQRGYGKKAKTEDTWLKQVGCGQSFVEDNKEFFANVSYRDKTFLVGHNRWATAGEVNAENAHPFTHGHITMVHNGTLDYLGNLEKGYTFDVDSEALCWELANKGVRETLAKVYGAFTLVWYDDKEDSLNIVRNEERPMCIAHVGGTIFYASERKMLEWILHRNNVDLAKAKIYELAVGKWITFYMDQRNGLLTKYNVRDVQLQDDIYGHYYLGSSSTSNTSSFQYPDALSHITKGTRIDITPVEFEKYKGKGRTDGKLICMYEDAQIKDAVVIIWGMQEYIAEEFLECDTISAVYKYSYNDNIDKGVRITAEDPSVLSTEAYISFEEEGIENVVDPVQEDKGTNVSSFPRGDNLILGANGVFLPLSEFKEVVKDGCHWCADPINPADAHELVWVHAGLGYDKPVCANCVEDYNQYVGMNDYAG